MTEQLLDRTDIRATLQKMGDKGVPQRVRAHRLHHSGPLGSRPGGMLNRSGVQVVTPDSLRPRILRKLIRREQPEPAPFLRRIGILHRKCIRRSSSRPSKKRNSKGEFPISTSKAAPSFVSSRLRVRPWFDIRVAFPGDTVDSPVIALVSLRGAGVWTTWFYVVQETCGTSLIR